MLTYSKIATMGHTALFEYYPEGDTSKPGVISFDFDSGECEITCLADGDRHSRYANHLANALESQHAGDGVVPSGTIMWY